jgi:hypothetical protein
MNKDFKTRLAELTQYLESIGWDVDPLPKIVIRRDDIEAQNLFGKTAYYEPVEKTIVLYTSGRHPKDVLRSYAHEMRHHHQNLSGQMIPQDAAESSDPKYAQNSEMLRKLEEDAFLNGNMAFRDYCDNTKYGK